MRISTTTMELSAKYGYEKAVEMIAQAGFDCADLSLTAFAKDPQHPLLQDDYLELVSRIRKAAIDNGIVFNQAHAPYAMKMDAYLEGGEGREHILFLLRRAIKIAGWLGVKNIVVHPIQHANYLNHDPRYFLQINKEFYGQLIPVAKETGVKIAIENMWQKHMFAKPFTNAIVSSVCSSPYELATYVDECNAMDDCFTACLDIGHCTLTGHDPVEAIRVLGSRLGALHVHDTDYLVDSHTCPLTQRIDFYRVMDALKEIGYQGDFTLEADYFFGNFREDFYPEALAFMAKVSRHLTSQ